MAAVSDPPSATVVLDGDIDIATAPAVRRFLMAAISGGNIHLAVDMSGVTFIDASGIGVLVAAAHRARQAGGRLSLLAPSRQMRWLLDVLHLDAILPAAQRSGGPSWRQARWQVFDRCSNHSASRLHTRSGSDGGGPTGSWPARPRPAPPVRGDCRQELAPRYAGPPGAATRAPWDWV